jgi:hypothetical protein
MKTTLFLWQKKCEKYWPEKNDTYENLSIKLQKTETFADFSIRTFFVSKVSLTLSYPSIISISFGRRMIELLIIYYARWTDFRL